MQQVEKNDGCSITFNNKNGEYNVKPLQISKKGSLSINLKWILFNDLYQYFLPTGLKSTDKISLNFGIFFFIENAIKMLKKLG